jgi:hypothetical protein
VSFPKSYFFHPLAYTVPLFCLPPTVGWQKLHFIYFTRSRSVVTRCFFLPPNPNKVKDIFIGGKTQLVNFRSPAGHCGHFCVTVFASPELVSVSLPLFAYSLLVMSQPILQTLGKSCSFVQLH